MSLSRVTRLSSRQAYAGALALTSARPSLIAMSSLQRQMPSQATNTSSAYLNKRFIQTSFTPCDQRDQAKSNALIEKIKKKEEAETDEARVNQTVESKAVEGGKGTEGVHFKRELVSIRVGRPGRMLILCGLLLYRE